MIKIRSAKQKSTLIFTGLQQRNPTFSSRPNYNQPFLSGPLPRNQQGRSASGRGRGFFFSRTAAARGRDLPSLVSSTEHGNSQSRNIITNTSCNKRFISTKGVPKLSTDGLSAMFFRNWEKLTSNSSILNIIKRYQIPFLSVPIHKSCPLLISMTPKENILVDHMLKKGVIKVVQ